MAKLKLIEVVVPKVVVSVEIVVPKVIITAEVTVSVARTSVSELVKAVGPGSLDSALVAREKAELDSRSSQTDLTAYARQAYESGTAVGTAVGPTIARSDPVGRLDMRRSVSDKQQRDQSAQKTRTMRE